MKWLFRAYLALFAVFIKHAIGLDPMKFPITIGGFDGDTHVEHIIVDSLGGIILGGKISDSYVTVRSYFIAYLPDGAETYSWLVGLSDVFT